MNKNWFLLRLNIFYCLYNDISNHNLQISFQNVSKVFTPTPLKGRISEPPGQIFTKFDEKVSSNINEVIGAVLNFSLFFTTKFCTHKKHKKHQKAQKAPKSTKNTKNHQKHKKHQKSQKRNQAKVKTAKCA